MAKCHLEPDAASILTETIRPAISPGQLGPSILHERKIAILRDSRQNAVAGDVGASQVSLGLILAPVAVKNETSVHQTIAVPGNRYRGRCGYWPPRPTPINL